MSDPKKMFCNTVDELIQCARLPMHAYPTVEFALRNIELPLNRDDYEWLNSNEINMFGIDSFTNQRPSIARGRNTTGPTFTVDTPTIATGVCIFAYGEPYSTVVEGNQFGPTTALTEIPASPINLRNQALALAALFNAGAVPAGLTMHCPAQLDWGGPTWRLIWAFLNSFRLQFNCPNSGYDIIMDERLVDIGNCCSLIDFSGLSDAKTPATFITRRMNARLAGLVNNLPTALNVSDGYVPIQDPGYFIPINCEQNSDFEITPNRAVADFAAYGRPAALPAIENWYRLPFPMPLDANTKLKLLFERSNGDEDYQVRLNDEGIIRNCVGPVPAIAGGLFPIHEDNKARDATGGDASFTQIPGGMLRLGVGIKGFQVREGVCHQWKRTLQDKSLLSQLMNQQYQVMAGTCGGPNADAASEIIDQHFSGGIEQVEVPAGPVGHRS